jgi:probable F420-dependent oxidoreductase
VPCPDPFTTIASMAAVTSTLRFMTYVYVLPMRDPFSVAKQVSSLAILSGDRFAFGVGVGWLEEEIALLGHDPRRRGPRTDEMLEICQGFWREGVYEHHGEFYDFGPAGILPRPDRHVPVWIGGRSKAALRRAARHDGWLGMNYPVEEVGPLLQRIDAERARYRDEGGEAHGAFRRFVMPAEGPTPEVYARLEDLGIDGTVAMAWVIGDPANASLEAKLEAMAAFSARLIRPA